MSLRVAVLKGGASLERQVSLRSAARVANALERLGHEVIPIDVDATLVQRLPDSAADVAFVALHGRGGEGGRVLLERHVKGRELAIELMEGDRGPDALPIVEAKPKQEYFFDFEARYEIGKTHYICPAELPANVTALAQELAVATYRLLGC